MTRPRVTTIVLAAGKGQRIGGPKALLLWRAGERDIPLAIAHAEARLSAESSRVLIVSRKAVINVLLQYVTPGIDLLSSDAADNLEAAGTLAFAAKRLPESDFVVVTPVDTPPSKQATVAALLRALEGNDAIAARPRVEERSGHPVVLRPRGLAHYQGEHPLSLRDYLRSLGDKALSVPVEDRSVLVDFNGPADFFAMTGRVPEFARG